MIIKEKNIIPKMRKINDILIEASDAYYNKDNEIMSNYEYDKLYDSLVELEDNYGVLLDNSITQRVGIEVVSSLKKVKHSESMLSLSKTKSIDELKDWFGDNKVCSSWKLDGLTVVLTYEKGKLIQAATRGNGTIGEDITKQAMHFNLVPHTILIKDRIVLRGEAIITYEEFDRINSLTDEGSKFKNPRNLASGTVKNLDLSILKKRRIEWIPFEVIEGHDSICDWIENNCPNEVILETIGDITVDKNSFNFYLDALWTLGFHPVEHCVITKNEIEKLIHLSEKSIEKGFNIPVDGLVFTYDNIDLFKSLGYTSHSPRGSIAFKWKDETYDTTLRRIVWNKSRTGRINPIAVFDPVEIDGTTVNRASLHNLTYIEDMKLDIGDEITVYKANMIIPQIAENKTKSLKDIKDVITHECPICGFETEIRGEGNSKFLYCCNKYCDSDTIDLIDLFLNQMKVMGVSKITIKKLCEEGILNGVGDIFDLKNHKEEFCNIEGLGEKTFDSLIYQIENIKTDLATFISSLGISGVNIGISKLLANRYKTFDKFLDADIEDIASIKGIGEKTAESIKNFINLNDKEILKEFSDEIEIIEFEDIKENDFITNKHFAITGKMNIFKNRKELQDLIESNGGYLNSVNTKTDYLITNDPDSGSSKNKKAKELNISTITEQEFINMLK